MSRSMTSVPDIKLIRTDTCFLVAECTHLAQPQGAGQEVFHTISSVPYVRGCQTSLFSLSHEPYPQTIYHPEGWKWLARG